MKILAAARMDLVGNHIDPVPVCIESRKHRGFIPAAIRIQPEKRRLLDEKGDLHRPVMRPEANAPMLRVEAVAEIGEL